MAINTVRQAEVWSTKNDRPIRQSSPALTPDGRTLIVGTSAGTVDAFSAASGALSWSIRTNEPVLSSPAISGDGRSVVVGSDDDAVYLIEVASGRKRAQRTLGGAVESSPAIGLDGTVYVATTAGELYALGKARRK
jgi:outer membrane protein assembly factor BamB